MKLKSLFAAALAAIVLASCTKEVIKYVGGEETNPGTALIRVSLEPPVLTKASADHYSSKPTDDESLIYNYALFIFNSNGFLEASFLQTIANEDNGYVPTNYNALPPNSGLEFTNDENEGISDDGVITLSTGPKTFFAIVNAPLELLAIQSDFVSNPSLINTDALNIELNPNNTNPQLSADLIEAIVGKYGDENSDIVYLKNPVTKTSNNRGFMMTTLEPNSSFYSQTLTESEDENDITNITLSVRRAMAKVSIASDLDPDNINQELDDEPAQPNGTLEALTYKIINNPTSMYVIPHITNRILTTPYYYNDNSQSVDAGKYFDSHNSSQSTGYVPISKFNSQLDDKRTFAYCIENGNLTPRQGTATIAVIEGTFIPGGSALIYNEITDANPITTPLTQPTTFFRIFVPQHQTGSTLVGGDYEIAYYLEEPTQTEIEAYMASNYPDYNENTDGPVIVSKYPDGLCYYRLPLYNENNPMDPYTVKRNSYYQINIRQVKAPGYTDENGTGIIDPTDPLEAQSHITVTIKVEDWDPVNQTGKL